MAEATRVVLRIEAFRELRVHPAVVAVLAVKANAVANAAGEGFEANVHIGGTRARATVRSATFSARYREAQDHVLLRALDAGR